MMKRGFTKRLSEELPGFTLKNGSVLWGWCGWHRQEQALPFYVAHSPFSCMTFKCQAPHPPGRGIFWLALFLPTNPHVGIIYIFVASCSVTASTMSLLWLLPPVRNITSLNMLVSRDWRCTNTIYCFINWITEAVWGSVICDTDYNQVSSPYKDKFALPLWNYSSFSQAKKLHTHRSYFWVSVILRSFLRSFSCPSCALTLCSQYLHSFSFSHWKHPLKFLAPVKPFWNAPV